MFSHFQKYTLHCIDTVALVQLQDNTIICMYRTHSIQLNYRIQLLDILISMCRALFTASFSLATTVPMLVYCCYISLLRPRERWQVLWWAASIAECSLLKGSFNRQ